MGHFKQEAIASQEDIDRLVAWYKYHQDKLPESYLKFVLEDEAYLWKAIELWESGGYMPKPASTHVALQSRDHIRSERYLRRVKRHDRILVSSVLSIAGVIITVVLIWGWLG